MTDAIRSGFEDTCKQLGFTGYIKPLNDLYDAAYQQGYLAAKSELIVLPTASFHEHVEDGDTGKLEDAYTRSEITAAITAQGYQVKES